MATTETIEKLEANKSCGIGNNKENLEHSHVDFSSADDVNPRESQRYSFPETSQISH